MNTITIKNENGIGRINMTQEEKQLLLIDLSARLPYETILLSPNGKITYQTDGNTAAEILVEEGWKLYLRPMSSMTEEENQELERLINEKLNGNTGHEDDEWTPWVLYDTTGIKNSVGGERFYFDEMSFIYDWLNAHHFDYRGLIEKRLALEAPEGMYN